MRLTLLDPGWDQSHHVAYHLAAAGHDVTLLTAAPVVHRRLTTYARQVYLDRPVTTVAQLQDILRHDDSELLLPMSDDTLELTWHLGPEFRGRVFPECTALQREALSDRRRMYAVTTGIGVPIPAFRLLQGAEDIPGAIAELGLPVVIRGTRGFAGAQVRVVDSLEAAGAAYATIAALSPDPPFAQGYIQGRRCLFGGLFHEGRALQYFSQMTVDSSTPTGPSTRIRSLRDERLLAHNTALFGHLAWTGLACAEYIRTPDGNFHFLEINPRPWATIQAAHVCGVPLMQTFAEYLHGDHRERESPFPDGKEVTLFPQFIVSRLRSHRFGQMADVPAYLQGLSQAPWFSPALMLRTVRQLWWAR